MKKEEKQENPYLNARKAHNEFVGGIIASRQWAWIICILSLLIALSAVGGVIYIGQQSTFVPYVVQVDKLGQSVAIARADQAAPVDSRVIHATVAEFITNARMVTPDVTVQRNAIFRLYACLNANDAATLKMNEYMNTDVSNPFKRASKETVSTEITSVLPQSGETWQIDWTETVRDRQGAKLDTYRMRALVNVYVAPPTNQTSEDQIRKNPLGIFIRDFNWSKQL